MMLIVIFSFAKLFLFVGWACPETCEIIVPSLKDGTWALHSESKVS